MFHQSCSVSKEVLSEAAFYHGKIITAINRAEPIDLGVAMCNRLDYHLRKQKNLVFPHTIIILCKMVGIDVKNVFEDIMNQSQPLGARAYTQMANNIYYPGYLDNEDDNNATSDKEEFESDDGDDDDDDANTGRMDVVLQQILAGQQHIIEKVDGYNTKLESIDFTLQDVGNRVKVIEDQLRAWPNIGEVIQQGVGNEDNQMATNQGNDDDA